MEKQEYDNFTSSKTAEDYSSQQAGNSIEESTQKQYLKYRSQTIDWLIAHGYPPLPVAPAQNANEYPKKKRSGDIERDKEGNPVSLYTGKNPSYLDDSGRPHTVHHCNYQEKLPEERELKQWFANSKNGVGTLGGWNNTIWLYFDVKHFQSPEKCDRAVQAWLETCPQLNQTYIERTHSNGWRIGVKVKQTPGFTNFALETNGNHVGEALGSGRFTVLSPTIGSSGNAYRNINQGELVEVESLEEIGIYPSGNQKKQSNQVMQQKQITSSLSLELLGSETSQNVLKGNFSNDDRSEALTTGIKEWYGWENWCKTNGINYSGDTETLAYEAGDNLGIDSDRIKRILNTVESSNCHPAALFKGNELSSWKKILKLDQSVFEEKCPTAIKDEITKSQDNSIPGSPPKAKEKFNQIAFKALYSNQPWICINDILYYWTGTYYNNSPDSVEKKRIRDYCDSYPVLNKVNDQEFWTYKYATPGWVETILKWAKNSCSIDSKLVNPPGVNCTNGVLEITWENVLPKWELIPHDPNRHFYTYEPVVTYNPDANPEICNRLLDCLEEPQQDIFLKTVAASLDLQTVRKYKGRMIRALLLKGDGNNGKDSLRETVKLLYGKQSLTGCTFSDFQQYDQGRKFPLAKLANGRVNWASENRDFVALDKLQSLKMAVTGDPIDIEGKGKDEYTIEPKCVFLFNINESPDLKAALEAIRSRYGILTFNKTYKDNPNLIQGELKADPRFKYDPEFINAEVLPAFLNRLLDALVRLMSEGIDYSCTDAAMEEIKQQSSHLYSFCKDVGLGYITGTKTYAGEIWQRLEQWYIANGTLTVEITANGKLKNTWVEQVKRTDKNVKGSNQVLTRFLELFPQAKRGNDKKGVYLVGIAFNERSGEAVNESNEPVVMQSMKLEALINQVNEAVEPVSYMTEEIMQADRYGDFQQVPTSIEPFLLCETGVVKIGSSASNQDNTKDTASPIASSLDRNCFIQPDGIDSDSLVETRNSPEKQLAAKVSKLLKENRPYVEIREVGTKYPIEQQKAAINLLSTQDKKKFESLRSKFNKTTVGTVS